MKLKSLLLVLSFSFLTQVFAANMHTHPQVAGEKSASKKDLNYPGPCEIEIINDSYTDVRVYGTFDDGSTLDFMIYRYEFPHYISLFYNFYCHSGMYLTIQSPFNTVYSGWTSVNTPIRIIPYMDNKLKAQVSPR